MLRLVGSLLVLMSTTAIGFRMAAAYRERPREIRRLLTALNHLQAEIEFQARPLPKALTEVGHRGEGTSGKLFLAAAEHLRQDGSNVGQAFSSAISDVLGQSALRPSDLEPVQAIANSLSTMDARHLRSQFGLAADTLSQAEEDAREEAAKTARLWQYLGILAGVMLVILLY
ncbi:hypothetical protein [Alicyclobacillus acidiphilus]|uniref:hypothetical protein n=1 Tax=Alicyclobacillus acidiphilus TaxID=182455 RepID=UPI00082D160A|nr:hypothetical protein [Alicyclobacillus acidiphilus]